MTAWFQKAIVTYTRRLAQVGAFDDVTAFMAFGYDLPEDLIDDAALLAAMDEAAVAAIALDAAADAFETAADPMAATATIIGALTLHVTALRAFASVLESRSDAVLVGAERDAMVLRGRRLESDVIGACLTDELTGSPVLAAALAATGVLALAEDADAPGTLDPNRLHLRLDRLADLMTDPATHFADTLGWGSPAFPLETLFSILRSMGGPGDPVKLVADGTSFGVSFGDVTLTFDPAAAPPTISLAISDQTEPVSFTEDLSEDWRLTFSATGVSDARLDLDAANGLTVGSVPAMQVSLSAEWATESPFELLASQVFTASVAATRFGLHLEITPGSGDGDFGLRCGLTDVTVELRPPEAAATIVGGNTARATFSLDLNWSAQDGLQFNGTGSAAARIDVHASAGSFTWESLTLGLDADSSDGRIAASALADVSVRFGPLSIGLQGFGVDWAAPLGDGAAVTDSALGGLRAVGPSGALIAIDAAAVSGGGWLQRQETGYSGAVELTTSAGIALSAVGLIERLPEGGGPSLAVIITAEFGSGIPLGFGFTLLGVGGMLGLNRSMNLPALVDGARNGALERLMFPANAAQNGPQIVSDLRGYFPPSDGTFLVAPMAKFGWGTPALIDLSLGIIIEIPGDLAIVGRVAATLPNAEKPLVQLKASFVGAIEPDRQQAYFFAVLHDLNVLSMTLDGEMGMVLRWGNDSTMLLSVGGFHPSFTVPPLPFPVPARVALSILNEPNRRIRLLGYFALTSNTAQFGARAELFLKFSKFSVDGHLAFDALFQFDPFRFEVLVSGRVSLRLLGKGLFTVTLELTLVGPAPWRAKGYGKIKLLFFSFKARFDISWGRDERITAPSVDVAALLLAQLDRSTNWSTVPPAESRLSVTLRREAPTDEVVLHPRGRLVFRQHELPLDLRIDKIGNRTATNVARMRLEAPGSFGRAGDVDEAFAIGLFQNLAASELLSRPAFQRQNAGLSLAAAGTSVRTGHGVTRRVRYETIIRDRSTRRLGAILEGIGSLVFAALGKAGAVARSPLSGQTERQRTPTIGGVRVRAERFVIADRAMNTSTRSFATEAKARDRLDLEEIADPGAAGRLHILNGFEAADTA